jgi:hypothetical protein
MLHGIHGRDLGSQEPPDGSVHECYYRSRFLLISKHANTYQSIYIRVRI